jgi:WD40 repeat protein
VRDLDNPYLGLAAFTYAERAKYAGRGTQVAEAVAKLTTPGEQRALLFITGASGSGKSSFAQAGLIPALEQHYQQRHQTVRHAVIRPSKQPLLMLSDALEQLGMPAALLDADIFGSYIRQNTPEQTINVIIIDQFEELFTQSEPGQRDALFTILEQAMPFSVLHTHLVATVRADYLPELFQHQALYEEAKSGIDLRAMTEGELCEAILCPLRQQTDAKDKRFEDALLDRLTADAVGDATYLPLLQVTLARLWSGGLLKLSKYGGLADAIQQQAEDIYATHTDGMPRPEAEQQAILSLLLELVDVSPTDDDRRDVRRRRLLNEVVHHAQERRSLITELATARLLSTSRETRASHERQVVVVDIIHESLLRKWERLRAAINDKRQALQQRARFELALSEWLEHERNAAYLITGVRLSEAESLDIQGDVALRNIAARELLQQSVAQRETERRRRLHTARLVIAALSVLLLLALGTSWVAVDRQLEAMDQQQLAEDEAERADNQAAAAQTAQSLAEQEARRAEDEAERAQMQSDIAFSRQLAAQSVSQREADLSLALLLAVQSTREANTLESRNSLLNGLKESPHLNTTLRGHTSEVESMAFSPDGQILASGSRDGTIIFWDIASGQTRDDPLEGHTGKVWSVVFSPDGATLASGSDDETIALWDVATRQQIGKPLEGHTDGVRSVAFSPDGQTLASGSDDGTIIFWDIVSGQTRDDPLKGHTDRVWSVAFSPDGQTLASGSRDGTIILWNVATGGQIGDPLEDHTDGVWSVTFSPDGQTLASGSWDNTIIRWEVTTRRQIGDPLQGHTAWVRSVAFSPDGQTLASSSADSTIIRWDVATGRQIGEPLEGHTSDVVSVVFSPDGQTLASSSANGTIILWNIASNHPIGDPLEGHTSDVVNVVFSPDGQTLVSGSADGTIIRWDVATGWKIGEPLEYPRDGFNSEHSMALSPDGTTVASALSSCSRNDTNFSCTHGLIILRDVATGRQIDDPVATGQQTGDLFEDHTDGVWSVAFSPDGQTLASGSTDGTITLWDLATRRQIGEPLRLHTHAVSSVAFSPDGQTLASGSTDPAWLQLWVENTIILVDVATGRQIGEPLRLHIRAVRSVAFSPDGQTLASGNSNNTITLWEVETRRQIGESLRGHTAEVRSVAFSPDGQTLASGSADGTIILWNIASQQPIIPPLRGHTAAVRSVAFSPDGQTLVSGSNDNTIRLWAVSIEPWKFRACRVAGRNLTWQEWQRYMGDRPYELTCSDLPPHPSAVEAEAAE